MHAYISVYIYIYQPLMCSQAKTMATAVRNTSVKPEKETFHKFFEFWLGEQNQYLQELVSATKHHDNIYENSQQTQDRDILCQLIDRVIGHYETYYRAKASWAHKDVLHMLSPSWRSSLEDAFLWIGGWKPSMAFHLLYSKSGLQLHAGLASLTNGLSTGDLSDLSLSQLNRVDELQRRTLREEKQICEKMAKLQETIVEMSMVELSHVMTMLIRNGEANNTCGGLKNRLDSALAPKEEGLEEILRRADDLRLRTLKAVIDILKPIQAIHFLIAAAELHLRLHEWGKKRDALQHHGNGSIHHPR